MTSSPPGRLFDRLFTKDDLAKITIIQTSVAMSRPPVRPGAVGVSTHARARAWCAVRVRPWLTHVCRAASRCRPKGRILRRHWRAGRGGRTARPPARTSRACRTLPRRRYHRRRPRLPLPSARRAAAPRGRRRRRRPRARRRPARPRISTAAPSMVRPCAHTDTHTHTGTDMGASRTGTRPRRTAQQCVLCAAGARTVSGGVVHAAASEPRGADSDRKQCATAAAQAASPHLPHVVRPAGGRASRSAHQAEPASAPRCRHGAVARSRVRACVCACAFGWAPWPGEEHECLQPAAPRAGPRDLPARHRPGISAHQPRT
jgi:hypothetical protein